MRRVRCREHPDELQSDQRQQNQQVDSERPEGDPNRGCRCNPCHGVESGGQFDLRILHYVLEPNHAKKVVLRVHDR